MNNSGQTQIPPMVTCGCAMCGFLIDNKYWLLGMAVLIATTCITVMVKIIRSCYAREKRLKLLHARRLRRANTCPARQ